MSTTTPKPRSERERKQVLSRVCAHELQHAEGCDEDELQSNRKKALEYYNAKPRGDEIEGKSKVISTDVADMVNATLAMIVPMISTDALVAFDAMGEDDEVQAQIESNVVNNVVMSKNNGFIEVQTAVKDALLIKNGAMKVRVHERKSVQRFNVAGADAEQRAFIQMNAQPNEVITIDGDTLKIVTTTRRFDVRAVPVENISYQSGFAGPLQEIRFFAEALQYTRSELVEMGVERSVVDRLHVAGEPDNSAARARNMNVNVRRDAETRDQDIIDCHECYQLIDLDGDGVSERYKVLLGNRKTCLSYEAADLVPYALGSPFLNPHRITGESLFDHLCPTQDSKTALQRQLHDNVTVINNGRYVYDPSRASEEDILKPVAGGGIRARDPGNSVVALTIPDVTAGIAAALNYEDQRRSERGGASLDLLTADAQLVGETAHGIERQYASREALATMMAKNIGETMVRGVFLLTHEFLRRYANMPMKVRINGQWGQVDPTTWQSREELTVTIGMSPGARGHLQSVLLQHMQLQAQAMSQGMNGVLASAETLHRTNQLWLRMAGVDNPERLSIDPSSPAAQEAFAAMQEAQRKAQERQDALLRMQFQLEAARLAEDARQADKKDIIERAKVAHAYYDTNVDADVAVAKVTGQGVIDLEAARITHSGNDEVERTRQAGASRSNASRGTDQQGG